MMIEERKEVTYMMDTTTPKALAQELGIDPKRLRSFLRANFTRTAEAKNTTWALTPDAVIDARAHFAPKVEAPTEA